MTTPAQAARWRQWRTPIGIGAFIVLAAIVTALLRPSAPVTGYLSPQGTDAFGARALADILAARGHPVQPVTTVSGAASAARPGTTLLITSPYLLTRSQARVIDQTHADLVIVEPDQATLAVLAPRLSLEGGSPVSTLAPGCPLAAARLAGPASMGGPGLKISGPASSGPASSGPASSGPASSGSASSGSASSGSASSGSGAAGVTRCYRQDGLPTLAQFRSAGRLVTVLSSGAPLANTYLARQGNAALAVNLLSGAGPVVWLVPAIPAGGTPAGTPRSFASLVPLAAYLVAAQLGVALLLSALWRARRLGPLVAEPLPVVVRASETVEGHARLYQSRRARDRVAATLRAATIGRLMPAVGLPARATPDAVTAALSARSTLDQARLASLLYGPVPASDAALVALASDLDALEGEVLRLER